MLVQHSISEGKKIHKCAVFKPVYDIFISCCIGIIKMDLIRIKTTYYKFHCGISLQLITTNLGNILLISDCSVVCKIVY